MITGNDISFVVIGTANSIVIAIDQKAIEKVAQCCQTTGTGADVIANQDVVVANDIDAIALKAVDRQARNTDVVASNAQAMGDGAGQRSLELDQIDRVVAVGRRISSRARLAKAVNRQRLSNGR